MLNTHNGRLRELSATVALMAVLAGCGGGGGGSGGGSSGPAAPMITAQPKNATVNAGGSAAFSVSASGSGLAYQWLRGGQAIAGATGTSYTLTPVATGDDQAKFSVTVSNAGGQVTSSAALLTVVSPPTITAQPQNTTVAAGKAATFSVTATAPHSTPGYQWYKGSVALMDAGNVSGSRSAVLSLQQIATGDAGSYSVVVSDAAGSLSSNSATLTVTVSTRLVVTASGVGLSQVGARSVLQRTIQVLSDSGRTDIPWTATCDSAWLSVTASGMTGGNLILTANPAGAPAAATQFADVSVVSADPSVTNQATIRVGLYVSSTAAATTTLSIAATHLATSPVEPLLAVAAGGTSLTLYNVYTGALVRTLSSVVAAAGPLTFGEDGRSVFVYDTTNLAVIQVDATTGAILHTYASPTGASGSAGNAIAVLHPNGFPMLATPVGLYYDLATGKQFADADPGTAFPSSAFSFAASPDQSLLAAQDGSTVRLTRSADGTQLTVAHGIINMPVNVVQNSTNGQSCFSVSGDRLYTASGAPYDFPATSVTTSQVIQTLPGNAYPDAIQCVWNGLVIGGIDGYYDSTDIYVYYGPTGVSLGQLSSNGPTTTGYRDLLSRGLAVSADGTVLASTWTTSGGANNTGVGVYLESLPAPP